MVLRSQSVGEQDAADQQGAFRPRSGPRLCADCGDAARACAAAGGTVYLFLAPRRGKAPRAAANPENRILRSKDRRETAESFESFERT